MFRAYRVFSMLRPARPRHPLAQALLAVVALCAFFVLLLVGVAIAAAVMLGGAVLRALAPARRPAVADDTRAQPRDNAPAAAGEIIDGEFSVVDKSLPHGSR